MQLCNSRTTILLTIFFRQASAIAIGYVISRIYWNWCLPDFETSDQLIGYSHGIKSGTGMWVQI